jgi:hypothetical protein
MANATANLITEAIGGGGILTFNLGVDGGTHIYKGVLVTQLTGTGYVVPYSTASAGVCVGVAQHEADNTSGADNALRVVIESRRCYAFTNGAGGDAFSEASLIGALVYATDDHTVADNSATQTLKPVGFFYGMESDGKVRVFIDPHTAKIVETLQLLTDAPASADALRENIIAAFG